MAELSRPARRRSAWAAALVVGVLAASGTAIAQAPDDQADVVIGSGSDTTYPTLLDLDELYNASEGCYTERESGSDVEQPLDFTCAPDGSRRPRATTENFSHDLALSYFPLGSSVGINQVAQQGSGATDVSEVSYARSSRSPRSSDVATLRFVSFAQDAIAPVTFPDAAGPSAGVTDLSQDQIIAIFSTCEIRDWRQVEGSAVFDPDYELPADYDPEANDTGILVYAAQDGSGTRGTFDDFIENSAGGESDSCLADPGREIFENNATPIADAGEEGQAIFYFSFGRFVTDAPNSSDLGAALTAIDGVEATAETIASNEFPFARRVFNVYDTEDADQPTRDYVSEDTGWLCKAAEEHSAGVRDAIESVIEANGFVPFPVGDIGGGLTGQSHCRVNEIPAAS